MIQFTFEELGVYAADYNGMTYSAVRGAIINIAAEYFTDTRDADSSVFRHYEWDVDFSLARVSIPDDAILH